MKILINILNSLKYTLKSMLILLCPHWWEYSGIVRKLENKNNPNFRLTRLLIRTRECAWCKKLQCHTRPCVNGVCTDWEDYEHSTEPLYIE